MGWLTGWGTKSDLVDHILSENNGTCTLVDSSLRGNNLWVVYRIDSIGTVLILFRLESYRGEWGYKEMDIAMGPHYYGCPERLVSQIDVFEGFAQTWIDQNREKAKRERIKRQSKRRAQAVKSRVGG